MGTTFDEWDDDFKNEYVSLKSVQLICVTGQKLLDQREWNIVIQFDKQ